MADCIDNCPDVSNPGQEDSDGDGIGDACEPGEIEVGDFRTQTQGGWGSAAHGNNPGVYRDTHFPGCFPAGLTVGNISTFSALFTSAAAIENFLPAGETAGPFTTNHTDPTTPPGTEAGILAGQAVALTLNVGFDLCDPDFGGSDINLAALIVDDSGSACFNWTVQQVLDEANAVLGGGGTLTPSQINDCASSINENFVDGTTDNGFLRLPSSSASTQVNGASPAPSPVQRATPVAAAGAATTGLAGAAWWLLRRKLLFP